MWLAYASLAAVCFGLRGILYQWTSQKPIERNLMLLGVYLSGALIAIAAAVMLKQTWSPAVWCGVIMGVFSFVSNASMYKGFAVGKASLVAIFTALTPIVVAGLSYFRWGETLNASQSIAFVFIVAGIVLIRYSNELSLRNLQGVQWALLAMVAFGVTDVASKQAMLWNAEKLPTLFVMYATGSVMFLILWTTVRLRERERAKASIAVSLAEQEIAAAQTADEDASSAAVGLAADAAKAEAEAKARAEEEAKAHSLQSAVRPAARWSIPKTLGWGAIVGLSNVSGMILILPAFELGITGLVSAVVATNVLLILLYVRFFLKERWSLKEMAGIVCALAGVIGLRLLE